jgi:hypothetical protein
VEKEAFVTISRLAGDSGQAIVPASLILGRSELGIWKFPAG